MNTFVLILTILTSDGSYKAEVIDHGLTLEDCREAAWKASYELKPGQSVSCEVDYSNEEFN